MDVTLEQDLASAIRFIQDNAAEGTEYYFGEIPENYKVPSIYFQTPYTFGSKATLRSYKTKVTLNVWFMAGTTWDAQKNASDMMGNIMLSDCIFPIVDLDGNKLKAGLRISDLETKRIENEIVQLSFSFNTYFHPKQDVPKVQKFYAEMQRNNR